MKPDINYCTNCKKEVSLRAKYCSDKCRKQYERKSDKLGHEVGQNVQIKSDKSNSDTLKTTNSDKLELSAELQDFRDSLSKTDKTFFDRAMKTFNEPYYNFISPLRKAKCVICNKEYQTTLSLNRFCSYQHYDQAHTIFVRKKKLTKEKAK